MGKPSLPYSWGYWLTEPVCLGRVDRLVPKINEEISRADDCGAG